MQEKEFLTEMRKIGLNSMDIEKTLIEVASYVKQKEDLADSRLKALQEYKKEEEVKKLIDEIKDLKRRSVAILSDKEIASKRKFAEEHYNSCTSNIELLITGTGLGHIIKCRCEKCNAIEDITDLDCW